MNKSKFSFILVGSTHGFIDDFSKQKEIIKSIKPEFVLSEELEDLVLDSKEKFNEFLQEKRISNMTSFAEVEKLVNLCLGKDIKLIGIDFHNFGFNKILQRKIKNQEELTKKEEEELNRIILLREKRHLEKILEYKKKTSCPLVVIVGCWHLREGSLLRKELKNYKIIAPCDNKGRLLFGPKITKKIRYCEITYPPKL